VPVLVQQGFRVVAPDLRGFGESSRPAHIQAFSLRNAQADVLAVLDALGIDRQATFADATASIAVFHTNLNFDAQLT
jgi:pimeloyl-ACP methyl ester carboxylesterase